jgi:hypothetical protein
MLRERGDFRSMGKHCSIDRYAHIDDRALVAQLDPSRKRFSTLRRLFHIN